MSQVFNSNDCRSALVFVRDSSSPSGHVGRRAKGAVRGTSAYLGRKGSNLAVFAKRIGSASRVNAKHEALGRVSAPADAPRLYHGWPSSKDEGDLLPVESTRAIDSIESELSALEGRLQQRGHELPSSRGNRPPLTPQSATPRAESHHDARSSPRAPRNEPEPHSRWDEFGRDSRAIERFSPIANFLARRYFRAVVTGLENVPAQGPCLLVANHSGSLPIDGLVLSCALSAATSSRPIRWLTEDFVQNLPFFGTYLQRLGAVRASRENVLRLLQNGECVVAFPEGFKGYAKPIAQFYRVQRLGRGRIVALCLERGVPLLPCAIVGGEEASPSLRRLEAMERWLGMPYFPITPTFPWLGPLGLLPAPSRWHVDIGPPFLTGTEAADADDPLYVAELTSRLRTVLQERVDNLLAKRQSA